MIEYRQGDIFTADTEAVVNTVNCVGVMGRGIALQFKEAYPANFRSYRSACDHGEVQPGRMFVFETGSLTNPRLIVNFPTKRHWRGASRMEDIEAGLRALAAEIRDRNIRSIAVPPLGSGLGGLRWDDVYPQIEAALGNLDDVRVILFEPRGSVAEPVVSARPEVSIMTPGRAALVALVSRYLDGLMDPFVTLLEVHKLMYFMQEAGEPLRLRYAKAFYGPYAENLRHVLHAVEGHLISGYADSGDVPDNELTLLPGAVTDAESFLAGQSATRARFDRVADLVQGFETPFGLELLSTLHWVAAQEGATTLQTAMERTYAWSARKRRFSEEQLEVTWGTLSDKGWLPVPA
ncbi:macro domain-containing protein [Frankia sp. Cas4]|uniref:type II toxin-antitoxin system antitoxin DNA ADP-ribosyl glycohydrolase DarG n=1 Tax=Frankia sp. Cas4 TaxID=3073927 RepID=UPI002AD4D39D|nr:macro domain-containing protein [Frankia sp. Cas4]